MMRLKPKVCLVEEDLHVRLGWESALSKDADLFYYPDHEQLLAHAKEEPELIGSFDCAIVGRYFKQSKVDVFDTELPEFLRSQGVGAIFLNWQGYLTKDEIHGKFEGRLFNRYGVRWQTLRTRIQKVKCKKLPGKKGSLLSEGTGLVAPLGMMATSPRLGEVGTTRPAALYQTKPQRCQELLKEMARQAVGRHRERLEFYALHDQKSGIQLLEAIYNRLLTVRESSLNCPSRYINSSPVVAKNILQKALFG